MELQTIQHKCVQPGPDLPIGQVGHGLGPTEFGGPLKPIYRANISYRKVEILLAIEKGL